MKFHFFYFYFLLFVAASHALEEYSPTAEDETVYIPPPLVYQCGKLLLMDRPFGEYTTAVNAYAALLEIAEKANIFEYQPHHRKQTKLYFFPGIRDRSEQVVAFDMAPPHPPPANILKIRDDSFRSNHRARDLPPPQQLERNIILNLDQMVCRCLNTTNLFGHLNPFQEKYVLGYQAFYRSRLGVVVDWHIDPPNECDFCAVYVFSGGSVCSVGEGVEETEVKAGDMYIFRPTTDYHMVGHSLNGQERLAVALQYYDIRRVPEACLDFSPAPLSVEEQKARMQGFLPTPKKQIKPLQTLPTTSLFGVAIAGLYSSFLLMQADIFSVAVNLSPSKILLSFV